MQKKVRNAKKCKKLRNANAMRKWNQDLHRIASHYCEENFSHFRIFSHLIPIALPSLPSTFTSVVYAVYTRIQVYYHSRNLDCVASVENNGEAAHELTTDIRFYCCVRERKKDIGDTRETIVSRVNEYEFKNIYDG
jgi:hypothetical protein